MDEEVLQAKAEAMRHDMALRNIKKICSEIIWDIIPEINAIDVRLSEECGRPVMDNIIWRVKSPESICKKLSRKGREISLDCALATLNDVAGIRVVCPFQDDVYRMAKAIEQLPNLHVIKVKNYIAHPKSTGYRSMHVIAEAVRGGEVIQVEIQVRSVAMNYWAILDHLLWYKNDNKEAEKIKEELKYCAVAISDIDKRFLKLRKKIEKL